MKKTALFALSALLWTACIALGALVWLDHLGGYDFIRNLTKGESRRVELFHTDYYGKPLERDPYGNFSVQMPNPFYLFGLPWTKDGIARANTDIISLNRYGFRNSHQNGTPARALFLGGSTAFGSQASSDRTTIPSVLNKLQDRYDFFNFGVPSWNSHQEMVAYLKAPFRTELVLAFSGANDVGIAFHYCLMGYDFPPGSPESFEHLARSTDNIRGAYRSEGFFARLFPQTGAKLEKLFSKDKAEAVQPDCRDRLIAAADAFIANQRVVRDLAVARGARYLLALQPHLDLIAPPSRRYVQEAALRALFYRRVLASDLCAQARCVDLSPVFKDARPLHIRDAPERPQEAIFADRVHLTDKGYARIAAILAAEIAQ